MSEGRAAGLVAIAATLVLSVPSTAASRGPDASNPPRTSGPLAGVPHECQDGPASRPDEVRGQLCSWTYTLAGDADADEEFRAVWVQMEIDPGQGWCATGVDFRFSPPPGSRIVSASSDGGARARSIAELSVDARGATAAPGTIAQRVAPRRGVVHVRMSPRSYVYRWAGTARRKVVVAVGLQLATPATAPMPLSSWEDGSGWRSRRCSDGS